MSVGQYDSATHDVTFAGHPIGGFADGSKVNVVPESDLTSDKSGVDGDVALNILHDARATATVSLLATSASNDVLTAFAKARIVGRFQLRDRAGTTLVNCPHAIIQRLPDLGVEAEAPNREWTIRLLNADITIGSTTPLSVA